MPGMSGRALIETMRSQPRLRDIPVVIISGSIPDQNDFPSKDCYKTFIAKPFDLDEVIKAANIWGGPGRKASVHEPVMAG